MEIILILLLLIPVIFFGLIVYVMKVYDNTNDRTDKDTNNKSDKNTVNIGDVFVYEPLRIMIDPFEDVSTIRDVDSRTYIVDDLKTNYEGVVWVKYHTLISHRRKKMFLSYSINRCFSF